MYRTCYIVQPLVCAAGCDELGGGEQESDRRDYPERDDQYVRAPSQEMRSIEMIRDCQAVGSSLFRRSSRSSRRCMPTLS